MSFVTIDEFSERVQKFKNHQHTSNLSDFTSFFNSMFILLKVLN